MVQKKIHINKETDQAISLVSDAAIKLSGLSAVRHFNMITKDFEEKQDEENFIYLDEDKQQALDFLCDGALRYSGLKIKSYIDTVQSAIQEV